MKTATIYVGKRSGAWFASIDFNGATYMGAMAVCSQAHAVVCASTHALGMGAERVFVVEKPEGAK